MRSVPKGTLRRPPRSSSVGFSVSEPPDSGPVLLPAPQYKVRKISVRVHKRVQAEMEVKAFRDRQGQGNQEAGWRPLANFAPPPARARRLGGRVWPIEPAPNRKHPGPRWPRTLIDDFRYAIE